jgi:hypothetical protein
MASAPAGSSDEVWARLGAGGSGISASDAAEGAASSAALAGDGGTEAGTAGAAGGTGGAEAADAGAAGGTGMPGSGRAVSGMRGTCADDAPLAGFAAGA